MKHGLFSNFSGDSTRFPEFSLKYHPMSRRNGVVPGALVSFFGINILCYNLLATNYDFMSDEIFFLSELISTSGANDMFMHEISENLYGVK